MEQQNKSKFAAIVQFIKFGIVGVSNTLVNYLVYLLFFSIGVPYLIANALGFIVSVLNAYFWGSRFVFKEDKTKEKRVWWKVLLKTYASYLLGFFINSFLLWIWVDVLNVGQYCGFVGDLINGATGIVGIAPKEFSAETLSGIVGPIINIFVVVPINFVINKFWAYRQKNIPQNAKVPGKTDDITVEEHTETKGSERS
ncbi:MAG: GtrA family protein [Ruminiclostridium sp.]|nr:GtrA family protein [Ruminiclostridium sp.]